MSESSPERVHVPDPWRLVRESISEEDSHREHAAALDATLFRKPGCDDELVFELEGGCLRLRASRR